VGLKPAPGTSFQPILPIQSVDGQSEACPSNSADAGKTPTLRWKRHLAAFFYRAASRRFSGTCYVWVVRLTGPRRVEVHTPDGLQLAYPGEELKAPGILRNPVRVEALYDPDASREAALRNLLQRRGYADLEAVQEKGRHSGQSALVLLQLRRVIGAGAIQKKDRQRILQLEKYDLGKLAEALLDFRKKSDLTAWLERH